MKECTDRQTIQETERDPEMHLEREKKVVGGGRGKRDRESGARKVVKVLQSKK